MATPRSTLALLAPLLLAARAVDGLIVSPPSGIRPLAPLLRTEGLAFQQTWTISPNSSDRLTSLELKTVGRVAVEFAQDLPLLDGQDPDAVAAVVVYGDSSELVDLIEPVAKGDDGLKLHVRNRDASAQGLIFTQVYVRERSLVSELSLFSSSDVIVGDGVVATNGGQSVALSNSGSGSLGLKLREQADIAAFDVSVAGTGSVHVKTPAARVTQSLSAWIPGVGSFKLYAGQVDVNEIRAVVAGVGEFEIKSDETQSTCQLETLKVQGTGGAKTGTVKCESVSVEILGSGSALVHATHDLTASVEGPGHVKYAGSLPSQVRVTGDLPEWYIRRKALKHKSLKPYKYADKYDFKSIKHKLRFVGVRVMATADIDPNVVVWPLPGQEFVNNAVTIEDMEETEASDWPGMLLQLSVSNVAAILPSVSAVSVALMLMGVMAALRFRRRQWRGYRSL